MTITPPCAVRDDGRMHRQEWVCSDDSHLPSLRFAAEAIRGGGAKAVLELRHAGRLAVPLASADVPVAPSAIPADVPGAATPRELTEGEIEAVIKAFGEAARRAILSGFDAVELDGADGALLQQFFSPHANRRGDQWGGSVENRAAFPIAVLEEVREVVRRNAYRPFGIGYRLAPEEISDPGITIEQTLELVEGLVACRPDWIHISTTDYFAGSRRSSRDRRPLAAVISERIAGRTGVLGAGSITTPTQAASVVSDGADLVGVGRALIVDPDWVSKVLTAQEDSIVACLPRSGADTQLSIPAGMYRRLVDDPDWVYVCPDSAQETHPLTSETSTNQPGA